MWYPTAYSTVVWQSLPATYRPRWHSTGSEPPGSKIEEVIICQRIVGEECTKLLFLRSKMWLWASDKIRFGIWFSLLLILNCLNHTYKIIRNSYSCVSGFIATDVCVWALHLEKALFHLYPLIWFSLSSFLRGKEPDVWSHRFVSLCIRCKSSGPAWSQ